LAFASFFAIDVLIPEAMATCSRLPAHVRYGPPDEEQGRLLPAPVTYGRDVAGRNETTSAHSRLSNQVDAGPCATKRSRTWCGCFRTLARQLDWEDKEERYWKVYDHATNMATIAAALQGEELSEEQLLGAFKSYNEGNSDYFSRPELQSMLYFAQAPRQGQDFITFLRERHMFEDDGDGEETISFDFLLDAFVEWRRCLLKVSL